MRYQRSYRFDASPRELAAFNLDAASLRVRNLLREHPDIELAGITRARDGIEIVLAFARPDAAAGFVPSALRDALGMPPGPARGAEVSAPGRPRGVRSGPPRRRNLLGQCPETVQPGKTFFLLARIAVSAGGVELNSFPVPPEGQDVRIVIHAPGLRVLGDQQQTVRVPADGDSQPVMFELMAGSPGVRKISVTAWLDGNFLGELPVEVSVDPATSDSRPRDRYADLSSETVDGAVSLQVRYDRAANSYRFQFFDIDNPREDAQLSHDPRPLVESLVNRLNQLAEGEFGYSADETRDYLMDEGTRLWQDLLPRQLREQFWERQHRITQLTIISDQDAVPWELLYPRDPGHDAGFLVEQFPVTRDVFDRPRLTRSLRLQPARFVRAQDDLGSADAEIAAVRELLGMDESAQAVVSEFTPLRQLVNSGGFGLLHFACHNSFSALDGSSIDLNNRRFAVTNMQNARIDHTLRPSAPLVFFNGCRTAGLAATYTKLDGWAEAFMQAGAGAFVGSLWSVTDGAAKEFAQEFYRQLRCGKILADAVTAARKAVAQQPCDPTWLAYTVYGDPRARL